MRILLINHYAGSPEHGMEYRPFYLGREWVRAGHAVRIVAASHSHLRARQPAGSAAIETGTVDGVAYDWLRTPRYSGNGVRRVANMLAFVAGLARARRRYVDFAPDAVIASSTYPWDIYPAASIARAAGARLVFEVHDLWPLSPMVLGPMSPRHPFIVSLQWAEDYACRHADQVVSLLPHADRHLVTRGMDPAKFSCVPNGIDVSEWDRADAVLPEALARALADLRRSCRLVVGYAGGHGVSNALDGLLAAAGQLEAHRIGVLLVGAGPEKARLMARARRAGLALTVFADPIPKASVPALLRSVDVLFHALSPSPLYAYGISPNKLMDYMAAGRPVVQAVDAGNDVVAQARCGLTVRPGDPDAIVQGVLRLAGLEASERDAMGRRGREHVLAHFDYRVLAQRFIGILSSEPGQPAPASVSTMASGSAP